MLSLRQAARLGGHRRRPAKHQAQDSLPGKPTDHSFLNTSLGRSQERNSGSVIPGRMGALPEETRGHTPVQAGGREQAPEAGGSKGLPGGGGVGCGPGRTLKAETGMEVKKAPQETESPVSSAVGFPATAELLAFEH